MDSDVTLRATKILDAVVSGGASAIGAVDHGTADIPLVDMLLERRSAAGALLALPTIIKRTPTAPATSAPHEAADVRRSFRMLTHSHMLRRRAAQTISFPQLRGMLECLLRRVLRADEAAAAAARAALSADFADVRRDAHEVVGLPLFVDYDAFADAAEVSPLLGDLFSPASFARLPRDSRGRVSLRLTLRYLRQRVQLSNVGRRLACYDSEGDGALREHDLENYVYESIAECAALAGSLQDNFHPFYVFTAVRKFFFLLDDARCGRVRIRELLASPVLGEWLSLFPSDHPHLAGPSVPDADADADDGSDDTEARSSDAAGSADASGDFTGLTKSLLRRLANALLASLDLPAPLPVATAPAAGTGDAGAATGGAGDAVSSDTPAPAAASAPAATASAQPQPQYQQPIVPTPGQGSGPGSGSGAGDGSDGSAPVVPPVGPPTLVDESAGVGAVNWFAASSAVRVYAQYLDLDADQNGLLSPAELARACGGTLTPSFIARVFAISNTYGGEMDFKAYLDFVLAVECRRSPASLRYLMRALDVRGAGHLGLPEIRAFFGDVASQMAAAGHDPVDVANVCDEVFDMARPARPGCITLDDLRRCGVGHTIMHILTDAAGFWQYDNREFLLQQQQQQAAAGGQGGGEHDHEEAAAGGGAGGS